MKNIFSRFALATTLLVGAATLRPAAAAPVTFWFAGKIDSISNPSNTLPAGIVVGTPFSGRVTYDGAGIAYSLTNTFPSGTTLDSYYNTTAGFSMLLQIGSHTIINATNSSGFHCGYVGVSDNAGGYDALEIETASADLILDGHSTLVGNVNPFANLSFEDYTKTAYSQASLPTNAPIISQFPNLKQFTLANVWNIGNTTMYAISGPVTVLSTNELIALNLKSAGTNKFKLGWPSAVGGFTLQSSTNLAVGNWQTVANAITDTNLEHTVTVTNTSPRQFFRLKK